MNILAGEVVGVFAHVERADKDGAGSFEPFDQRRVAARRRAIAVDFRSGAGRKTGHVEQVLHRERYARQRAERLAGGARTVERQGARPRPLRGNIGEGVERRIGDANAFERSLNDRRSRGIAGGDRA